MDSGKEGFRKEEIQEMRDSGKEGLGKRGMQCIGTNYSNVPV